MLIVEVERRKDGDRERVIAQLESQHGMAAFHAQLICRALNKHVHADSPRYYKVAMKLGHQQEKEAA